MVEDNELVIEGTQLHGARVYGHKDHRIAMALSIAALGASGSSVIEGIECIDKTYPSFIEDLHSLGAQFALDIDRI